MAEMKAVRVFVVSPFSGDVEANVKYAIACVRDCFDRGETPLAGHLHYPQCLNDEIPAERQLGMAAGVVWMGAADRVVVYIDRGFSSGMLSDIESASKKQKRVEFRKLPVPFVLTDGHREILREIAGSGEHGRMMIPAHRDVEAWHDLFREGYYHCTDRLQQMAELTPKGVEALGAED